MAPTCTPVLPAILAAVLAAAGVTGCFSADVADASLSCTANVECPAQLVCFRDRCRTIEATLDVSCGDGIVAPDGSEACDDGSDNADTAACTTACRVNVCGDGLLLRGVEVCDDGGIASGDGCRGDCLKLESCGDGVIDEGEVCDDRNTRSADGCRGDCQKLEVCGDGVADDGEACDDGNTDDGDACLDRCVASRCGDGEVQRGVEVCDGDSLGVSCTDTCVPESCTLIEDVAIGVDSGEIFVEPPMANGMLLHAGPGFVCFGPGPEGIVRVRATEDVRVTFFLSEFEGFSTATMVAVDGVCGGPASRCQPPDFNGFFGTPQPLRLDMVAGQQTTIILDTLDQSGPTRAVLTLTPEAVPPVPLACADATLVTAPVPGAPVTSIVAIEDVDFGSSNELCGRFDAGIAVRFVATVDGHLRASLDAPDEQTFTADFSVHPDDCRGQVAFCHESDTDPEPVLELDVFAGRSYFVVLSPRSFSDRQHQRLTLSLD